MLPSAKPLRRVALSVDDAVSAFASHVNLGVVAALSRGVGETSPQAMLTSKSVLSPESTDSPARAWRVWGVWVWGMECAIG